MPKKRIRGRFINYRRSGKKKELQGLYVVFFFHLRIYVNIKNLIFLKVSISGLLRQKQRQRRNRENIYDRRLKD